ncbi:hypothetical protein GCM10023084_43520 [Streptomyces lacrimifluminis]|uniref:Uncharacterized protein n=1 Tax=Streptomyces lacrimifluminis TaxID=1500077 RepID=A0A917KFS4_9ACTN|nr:hypothetical protein GCM10012282_06110 [Streptomyces lacrimifluminis]
MLLGYGLGAVVRARASIVAGLLRAVAAPHRAEFPLVAKLTYHSGGQALKIWITYWVT